MSLAARLAESCSIPASRTTVVSSPAAALAFETCGNPNGPVVVVQGGISARAHVCAHPGNPMPGWWEMHCGVGRAIDLQRFFVVSLDFLEDGATTDDQADALATLLADLRIERLHAFVGASYGAMVGLAFAVRHPDRLNKLVSISGAHRAHPFSAATRGIQRRIVELGRRHGGATGAAEALALARELAMTTYRSPEEFDRRFAGSGGQAASDAYLAAAGRRFAESFPIGRFLSLSRSLDRHQIDPAGLTVETLLVGVRSDRVVPIEDLRELARESGPWTRLIEIDSLYGHDAFLKETELIARPLRAFLGGAA